MFCLVNGGQFPQRATRFSAGFDVFANEDTVIGAGETKVIGLGICLEDRVGYFLAKRDVAREPTEKEVNRVLEHAYLELHPRSSLRIKGLWGGVGIIDMDYRDEIKMVIHNPQYDTMSQEMRNFTVHRGDKIGQLILKRHEGYLLPTEYTKDEERNGGFGSTD